MVRKLDNAIINAKVFATHTLDNMKRKVSGDETLIIKIMLMVIAVALVIIFRDTLQTIIKTCSLAIMVWKRRSMQCIRPQRRLRNRL